MCDSVSSALRPRPRPRKTHPFAIASIDTTGVGAPAPTAGSEVGDAAVGRNDAAEVLGVCMGASYAAVPVEMGT